MSVFDTIHFFEVFQLRLALTNVESQMPCLVLFVHTRLQLSDFSLKSEAHRFFFDKFVNKALETALLFVEEAASKIEIIDFDFVIIFVRRWPEWQLYFTFSIALVIRIRPLISRVHDLTFLDVSSKHLLLVIQAHLFNLLIKFGRYPHVAVLVLVVDESHVEPLLIKILLLSLRVNDSSQFVGIRVFGQNAGLHIGDLTWLFGRVRDVKHNTSRHDGRSVAKSNSNWPWFL